MPIFDLAHARFSAHAKHRWRERIRRGQDPAMLRALCGAGPLPAAYRKAIASRSAKKRGHRPHGIVTTMSFYSADYDAIFLIKSSAAGPVVVTVLCGADVLAGDES